MKLLFLQESPMYEALGVHCLAGCVQGAGHEIDLLIQSEEADFFGAIKEVDADLIAFSFMTRSQEWAIYMIDLLKNHLEDSTPVLIGGTHPTIYPETLGHCEADFLNVGEGEESIVDLLNAMEGGHRVDNIPNIHAKINGEIIENPIRPLIQKWDDLPLPERDVYHRYPFLGELPLKRFVTSIGCAYKCSFCYINNYRELYKGSGKFYRRKSYDRVIAEMKATRAKYPMRRIHYVDDIFSLDSKWVQEFLPIYSREIGVPWTANIWINHLDYDTVKLYKEHGCAGLTFGVESGDEDTRRGLIDKNITDDTFVKHCGFLKEFGIPFHTGNIIGLPGEGLEEAYETARFNRRIGATSTRSGLFWPFPGTKLAEYAMDHGMLEADFSPEYFNRGIYPKVKNPEVDELTIMSNMFQLISKWRWFELVSRHLLRFPRNFLVKSVAKLVDQWFWFSEARFFGLLNWSGVKYGIHLRKSLASIRNHESTKLLDNLPKKRISTDLEGQKPLWNMGKEESARVYERPDQANRDGIT